MYYIYRHILPDGKSYIGMTKNTKARFRSKGNGYKKCTKFYKAIEKYGWDNILTEILFTVEDDSTARGLEKEMIEKYNSIEDGYNSVNKKEVYTSRRKTPIPYYKQYSLNGDYIRTFKGNTELIKNGFLPDYITNCCRGRIKSSQGYKWKRFYKKNSTVI